MNDQFSPIQLVRSGRWTSALFGTYVLSLGFFEGVVLPALRQSGVRRIDILADVHGVAGALGEAGAREVGRTYGIHPVNVRSGVFHPKFLLLDGPEGPGAIIGSGNLTFGGWGHNLELCEFLRPDHSGAALRDVADFLEELAITDQASGVDADLLEYWIVRLRGVVPSGDVRVVHSVSTSIATQLVAQVAELGEVSRITFAAPYFGGSGAVEDLVGALGSPAVDVHVHDGDKLARHGHHFPFLQAAVSASPVTLDLLEPGGGGPLHAKLVEIECELGCLLLTGSVNASRAALSEPRNVELGVVRILDNVLPRTVAELPSSFVVETASMCDTAPFGILRAQLLGTWLKGEVLTALREGTWSAEFDHDGVVHDVGVIDIGADGAFESAIPVGNANYARRRSTLVLRRGEDQIRGFVSFPDAIELHSRWGASIGPMIRVAGGSDDDDDLAGVLEYFASNPGQTTTPWRTGGKRAPQTGGPTGMISISDLAIQEASDDEIQQTGVGTLGAFDRILGALRLRWTTSPVHKRDKTGGHAEEEDGDDGDDDGSDKRVIRAFDALLEVLAERVPLDPAVELLRAADIAGFVLLRIPEARRIAEFAAWWGNLAVRHLRSQGISVDFRPMVAGMLVLEGLAASGPDRTRGRLARVLGDVEQALGLVADIEPWSRIRRLTEALGGPDAIEVFAARVRETTSAVEEVIIAARHVDEVTAPPPLPLIDATEEMRAIRRHLIAGDTSKILRVVRDARSCPRCNYALPEAQRHQLASIGIARTVNCCNRVLLIRID